MSTIENFIFGVRMVEKRARARREDTDQRIAKDIELDPRKSATLRGITEISTAANRAAQSTLDTLLDELEELINMLDAGDVDAK